MPDGTSSLSGQEKAAEAGLENLMGGPYGALYGGGMPHPLYNMTHPYGDLAGMANDEYSDFPYGHSNWWEFSYWQDHLRRANDAIFYVALGMIIVCVAQWAIHRFTDGIWPSERKLAREMREKAQRYKESKKSEREGLLQSADNVF